MIPVLLARLWEPAEVEGLSYRTLIGWVHTEPTSARQGGGNGTTAYQRPRATVSNVLLPLKLKNGSFRQAPAQQSVRSDFGHDVAGSVTELFFIP
jgi:hypothetical protein